MTSDEPAPAARPRRKWGWIFLAAFVVQAAIFIFLIAQIARQIPSATALDDPAATTPPANAVAPLTQEEAERLRLRLTLLLLGASTFSILTLAGALIGLRKPSQPAVDRSDEPPTAEDENAPR
jgi:hypothetical protein